MERFELAAAAVREAGAALRQSRLKSSDIEVKTGYHDLVTYWDRRTERLLRGRILSAFPGDAIVGEEYPPSGGESGAVWYIDPIDGTTNFINQGGNYAISVGCWAGGEPLFGLVLDVERDALYSARPGAGAWLEGRPLHVTSRTSLCEMLLTTPGVQYSFLEPHPWQERLVKLARAVRGVRCLGSVALELCELAAGKADLFVTCHSYHALRRAVAVLDREQVPWVIIGKGSNLLVADGGYRGAVISLGREFQRTVVADDGCTLTVGAGVMFARLVNDALSRSLSGLEFAVGIPGSVGGAISMNAGTRTEWIGSLVEDIVTFDPASGIKHYAGSEITWGYRECSLPRNEIILECVLKLKPAPKADIRERMERYLTRRKRTQPMGRASCGSVFRNPPDASVGKLIEDCGLKGFSIGGAEVSPVHANFIVNNGTASADDVAAVIRHVHGKVREAYGIELRPEVKFLGF
jgi:UDP-N-acetylmuramate dehydrogenase